MTEQPTLTSIIRAQIRHQTQLGKYPISDVADLMVYVRDTCLALNVEVAEFLQELPWKPWAYANTKDAKYDKPAASKELVDIIIFTLNLWIALQAYAPGECTAELTKLIQQKQQINLNRLKSKGD